MENKVKDLDSTIKETFKGDLNATRESFKKSVKKILLEINFNDKCNLSIITGQKFHGDCILYMLPSFVSIDNFGESEYKQILGKLIEKIQAVNIQGVMEKKAELNQEKKNQQSQINNFCDKNFIGYIRNKIANGKSNDFFAISEAINEVDLELSMIELDKLAKQYDIKPKNVTNENKIEDGKESGKRSDLDEKCKDIKENLKCQVKSLKFNNIDDFKTIIDRYPSKNIDDFKEMVKSFQEKFNEYQNSENDQKIQIESKLFESLYDGLKKQVKKILEDKKDNPDILAMDFVLGLVDECHKHKKTTGVDKIQIDNIALLNTVLNNFAESGKFKYDDLYNLCKNAENMLDVKKLGLNDNLVSKLVAFFKSEAKNNNSIACIFQMLDINNKDEKNCLSNNNTLLNYLLHSGKNLDIKTIFDLCNKDNKGNKDNLETVKNILKEIIDYRFSNIKDNIVSASGWFNYVKHELDANKSVELILENILSYKEIMTKSGADLLPEQQFDIQTNADYVDYSLVKSKQDLIDYINQLKTYLNNIEKNCHETKKTFMTFHSSFKHFLDILGDNLKQMKEGNIKAILKNIKGSFEFVKSKKDGKNVWSNNFDCFSKILNEFANSINGSNIMKCILQYKAKKFKELSGVDNNMISEVLRCFCELKKQELNDEEKNELREYFWENATDIKYFINRDFNEQEVFELYEFIVADQEKNSFLKMLVTAVDDLGLNLNDNLAKFLNHGDNFKNIVQLVNKKEENENQNDVFKSILKSLVKQKFDEKGGFVAAIYYAYYEKKIDKIDKINEELDKVINGVKKVSENNFSPNKHVVSENINTIKKSDESRTSGFSDNIEFQVENNEHLKTLVSVFSSLKLDTNNDFHEFFNQNQNFDNIINLINPGKNEDYLVTFKSVLKSLVKQKLDKKGGFVSKAYCQHYQNQINFDENINANLKSIIDGVQKVCTKGFEPETKILLDNITVMNEVKVVKTSESGQAVNNNRSEEEEYAAYYNVEGFDDLYKFWKVFQNKKKKQGMLTNNDIEQNQKANVKNVTVDLIEERILIELSGIFSGWLNYIKDAKQGRYENDTKNNICLRVSDIYSATVKDVIYLLTSIKQKEKENKDPHQISTLTKLLKDYCNGIQNQIFRLSLESQIDNLFKLNSGKLETLLQRIQKAKTSGNKKELTQEDENDLENYFWSNATEIFKSKKKFTKAEANAFYELISKESKKNENMYFELLVKAICEFKLNNEENLFAIFEQSKNFEGIISLKNEQDESSKLSAFKSVLTFLIKQKLDQKKGFVAVVYCANFEKQINNLKIDSGKKINQSPLMGIISGINKFTENNLEPDFKILVENVNSISNEKDLRDFWECFYSKEKKYSGKDKKNKQNEDDNYKLLIKLSYVFIDLIDNKKKFQNDFKIENLIKTTKEFVSVLYRLNENENQQGDGYNNENLIHTSSKAKSNDKNIKNDIGLINVLNEYYKMYFDRNEQELSGITNQILKHRIARFHTLGDNQKIKLLQYMKNVKNNKPIDYDSNTGFTKTLFSFFKNSSLFEDNSIQSDNLSSIQFQKKGEKKLLLQSVIENVDKDVITEPKDKKSFTEAVLFVIKERIEIMKRNYNSNNTTEINKIEDIKAEFENVIIELKNKNIITKDDLVVLNNKMKEACDLWTIVAVLEWFASLLSTMVIVGLCFKAVRRTLCAPIKSRQTRHFIKSAENINDGICCKLHDIAKLPLSENNNTGTNLDK